MNEMSLDDIQRVSLDILKSVDEFCQDNGIQYSLGYGALIGAVRHYGFIPWDDDIDLIMTRPNYDKFVSLFNSDKRTQSEGLKLYAPELGNTYFNISHICDMRKTKVLKYYQWTDEETGLWIDVFPIDALPSDQGMAIRHQSNKCFNVCGAKVPLTLAFGFNRLAKVIGKRLIYGRSGREQEIRKYLELVEALPPYNESTQVCNFGSPYGLKDIHAKELFDSYIRMPFDKIEVSVISKYDEYLRHVYNDYMQLPPPDQQVRGHAVNKYFWK